MPEQPAPFNLDSLLTHREECLAPTPGTEVLDAKLLGAEIKYDTEHRSRIACQSSDLFASPHFQNTLDQVDPAHAHVTKIQLQLQFREVSFPCIVSLTAPDKVQSSHEAFTRRILDWLAHSHFSRLAQAAVSKTLIILALALTAIFSSCPGLDPGDDDTPDDQEDTHSLSSH